MFQFDPTLHQLPATTASIAYLAESSNQPNVAVPGRQAQAAQAFVVALHTSAETVSVYVSLWLVLAREPAVYVYEKRHLPLASLESVVEEAWHFCESMGFMMDAVPFATRSAQEQAALLDRLRRAEEGAASAEPLLPLAAEPPAALSTPGPAGAIGPSFTPSPAQLARLGRLLASF